MEERDFLLALVARISKRIEFVHQLKNIDSIGLATRHETKQLKEMIDTADKGIAARMIRVSQIISNMDTFSDKDCIEVNFLSKDELLAGKKDISKLGDGTVILDLIHFKILRITSKSN